MGSNVKDMSLAPQGALNIEWAEMQMGGLLRLKASLEKSKPFKGVRVGMCLHITKETAVLVNTLRAAGAEVSITGCNPLSTQDDVAAALAKDGVDVYGWRAETNDEYYECLNKVLDTKPQYTVDDGCDLVTIVHTERQDLLDGIFAGAEETTTGVIRLRAMEKEGVLKYPMVAVNDSDTKHLMDNFIGTGQSTIDGILRASNVLVASKNVVIAGYGSCGKGVSKRAAGLGANVTVTEVNPFRALQASMDGWRVMPMTLAAPTADIIITVTGCKDVVTERHFPLLKDGAILANSGHFDSEVNVKALGSAAKSMRRIRPDFDEYTLPDGRRVFVCGEGRLVNLAAAEGHPSTIMAMSFMDQTFALKWVLENRESLENKVYVLPEELDMKVARLQLESMKIDIDVLTPEQDAYLNSWQEGT
ncbi:MAG: adenosylhomocysteinase [Candidatus Undinarchaeales archaeon]|jgi:adenosylhomocysteinase|nr:adenosylhomocysteinase [Candidatus Undinarchaeales archaeon]MDP7492040.1 adenosylhomocysteinase [Candidatus Undinarchaeales archaeon]